MAGSVSASEYERLISLRGAEVLPGWASLEYNAAVLAQWRERR